MPRFVQAKDDSAAYFDIHHVSMGLSLFALVALSAACLSLLGASPGWALLLFLPGTTYFSFNRFDAWPAALVALAVWQQVRGRPKSAAFALGLGAMMKWYPILLVPLFLAHNLAAERAAAEHEGRGDRCEIGFAEPATGISCAFLQTGDPDTIQQFLRGIRMSELVLALGRD